MMENKDVKYVIAAILVFGAILFMMIRLSNRFLEQKPVLMPNGITILIDAGHGGDDPGAVSENGTRESELNLVVANYLKDYLEENGFKVIMTRTDDESLPNSERKRIMRDVASDAVVSIHMNKFSDGRVHGAETFYYAESEKSKALAESVQDSLKTVLDEENKRTVKGTTSLFAVKTSSSPSILVECGYISNEAEEKKLLTPQYQRRVAFAICCGIMSYFVS